MPNDLNTLTPSAPNEDQPRAPKSLDRIINLDLIIRLATSMLVAIAFQSLLEGPWDWLDFAGRSITIVGIAMLVYFIELQ